MIPVHLPVMLDEVLDFLAPGCSDALFIDASLGEGGHAAQFLERYTDCRVVGIDADEAMRVRAGQRLASWAERFDIMPGWADEVLADWEGQRPHRILMDLGISRYHYEGSGRGFSFRAEEPLDMRLDPTGSEKSAADLVNGLGEKDLADLIYRYGEENYSRRIARRIVRERHEKPFKEALAFAEAVSKALPPSARFGSSHAATRTFQALRIAVNKELEHLDNFLELAPRCLAPGGRLGIISFHSLEDRRVKQCFRALASSPDAGYRLLAKKPLRPSTEERQLNPSARSAKFRGLEKLEQGEMP